jgi:sugar-specific transcriptional regulator TrmB
MLLDAKILATLQKLGLTYYEAKVYATLVAIGATTATVLSTESEVPRTKIYDVLKRLEERKWITVEKGRPCTYSPRYPKEVVEERRTLLCSELDDCSNALGLMYDRQIGKEAHKLWLIRGVDNISAKIFEMIDRAKQSVIMMVIVGALPFSPVEIEYLKKKIIKVKKKDVTVHIVAPPKIYLGDERIDIREVFRPVMTDIRLFPPLPDLDLPALDPPVSGMSLCIDRKEVLLTIVKVEGGVPDLESTIAIWMPNATITQYIMNMSAFDRLWEEAEQVR